MVIQQLPLVERDLFAQHLKRLDWDDRLMRFESSVNDGYIERYVQTIQPSDAIFGAADAQGNLIGAAHISLIGDVADLGMSVEANFRRQGLGSTLLDAAIGWAHAAGAKRFSSQCLSHNRWMTTRMRRLGFSIDIYRDTTLATLSFDGDDQSYSSFTRKRRDAGASEAGSYGAKVYFRGLGQGES